MIIPSTSIAFSKLMMFDEQSGPEFFQGRLSDSFFTGENRRSACCRRRMGAGVLRADVLR